MKSGADVPSIDFPPVPKSPLPVPEPGPTKAPGTEGPKGIYVSIPFPYPPIVWAPSAEGGQEPAAAPTPTGTEPTTPPAAAVAQLIPVGDCRTDGIAGVNRPACNTVPACVDWFGIALKPPVGFFSNQRCDGRVGQICRDSTAHANNQGDPNRLKIVYQCLTW